MCYCANLASIYRTWSRQEPALVVIAVLTSSADTIQGKYYLCRCKYWGVNTTYIYEKRAVGDLSAVSLLVSCRTFS